MGEEDLSKAFGYEETKDLSPKKTVKKLKSMGVDNAVERAKEFGKDPSLNQDLKKPDSEMRIRITEKEKIQEIHGKNVVAYAEKHALDYVVNTPQKRSPKPKAYADNFAYDRSGSWTH